MSEDTIQLLNPFKVKNPIRVFHFYDGRAPVEGGVITIPANKPQWVQRAYIMGFNRKVDGSPTTVAEALGGFRPALVAVSAESTGETNDEGLDAGGLPGDGDGVRSSEPEGPVGDDEGGDGSSVGIGVAEGSEGDDASGDPVPS